MRNLYKTEFRYFDFDIPTLPAGFIDCSWHNNVSPSFERKYNETEFVTLWVDYANPKRRECGGKQFTLTILKNDDLCNDIKYILETDSWDEMLNKVNELFNEVKQ
jgi:hypothetical protein